MNINTQLKNNNVLKKITALWAFSEAALGGILHALRIPLTGLFIGSSAVIFISLISYFSQKSSDILKITLKVIVIKFVVSPYSPLAAYFSVVIQGILGSLLFYRGFNKISAFFLGILSLLFSSFQKFFILTIIFGFSLWESIDIFFRFILTEVFSLTNINLPFNLSYVLIALYVIIHLIAGILVGIFSANLPSRLKNIQSKINFENLEVLSQNFENLPAKKIKRKWWQRKSNILLLIFSLTLIVLSFLFYELGSSVAIKVVIMLVRSIFILIIWYYFISPIVVKLISKYLNKMRKQKSEEIEELINVFPTIKKIIAYTWEKSSKDKGLNKYLNVFFLVIITFLLFEPNKNEK